MILEPKEIKFVTISIVKIDTKLIVSDTAQVGEHTEKQFVQLRQSKAQEKRKAKPIWTQSSKEEQGEIRKPS